MASTSDETSTVWVDIRFKQESNVSVLSKNATSKQDGDIDLDTKQTARTGISNAEEQTAEMNISKAKQMNISGAEQTAAEMNISDAKQAAEINNYDAEQAAERTISDAKQTAEMTIYDAKQAAVINISDAEQTAEMNISKAKQTAEMTISDAEQTAERTLIISDAKQTTAEMTICDAKQAAEMNISDAEQTAAEMTIYDAEQIAELNISKAKQTAEMTISNAKKAAEMKISNAEQTAEMTIYDAKQQAAEMNINISGAEQTAAEMTIYDARQTAELHDIDIAAFENIKTVALTSQNETTPERFDCDSQQPLTDDLSPSDVQHSESISSKVKTETVESKERLGCDIGLSNIKTSEPISSKIKTETFESEERHGSDIQPGATVTKSKEVETDEDFEGIDVAEVTVVKYSCRYCAQYFWDKVKCAEHVKSHKREHVPMCSQEGPAANNLLPIQQNVWDVEQLRDDKVINESKEKMALSEIALESDKLVDKQNEISGGMLGENRAMENMDFDDRYREETSKSDKSMSGKNKIYKTKKYTCPYCGKSFNDSSNRNRHVRGVHTKKGMFRCQNCDKQFVSSSDLNRHVGNVRSCSRKLHKCDNCQKSFKTIRLLKRHVVSCHGKDIGDGDQRKSTIDADQSESTIMADQKEGNCEIDNDFISIKFEKSDEEDLGYLNKRKSTRRCKNSDTKVSGDGDQSESTIMADQKEGNINLEKSDEETLGYRNKRKSTRVGKNSDTKVFRCIQCGQCFDDRSKQRRHIRAVHTRNVISKCEHCKEQFVSTFDLERHVSRIHSAKVLLKCEDCQMRFKTMRLLKRHVASCHGSESKKQDAYDQSGSTVAEDQNDEKSDTDNDDDYFPDMNEELEESDDLKEAFESDKESKNNNKEPDKSHKESSDHRKKSKSTKRRKKLIKNIFTCPQCGKRFNDCSNRNRHIRAVHTKKGMLSCKDCEKQFVSASDLKRHNNRIHSSKKCNHCEKSFTLVRDLKAHIRYHHGKESQSKDDGIQEWNLEAGMQESVKCKVDKIKDGEIDEEKPIVINPALKCGLCEKEFHNQSNLNRHIKIVHLQEKKYTCDICKKGFSSRGDLKRHVKRQTCGNQSMREACEICGKLCHPGYMKQHLAMHEAGLDGGSSGTGVVVEKKIQLWECKCCFKVFNDQSNMRRHIRAVHLLDKKFTCKFCDKKFSERGDLKTHLWRHAGVKPFLCQFCSKSFAVKYELTCHIKKKHSESSELVTTPIKNDSEKKMCEICGKSFKKQSFHTHLLVHEKICKCSICGEVFKGRFDLNAHIDTAHTKEKPFRCTYIHCNKGFPTKAARDNHVRRHAIKKKQHICQYCLKPFSDASNLRKHLNIHTKLVKHVCEICGKNLSSKYHKERHIVAMHLEAKKKVPSEEVEAYIKAMENN